MAIITEPTRRRCPHGIEWRPIGSTEDSRYGGEGRREIDTRERWTLSPTRC